MMTRLRRRRRCMECRKWLEKGTRAQVVWLGASFGYRCESCEAVWQDEPDAPEPDSRANVKARRELGL